MISSESEQRDSLAIKYQGKEVRIYLVSGTILSGTLEQVKGFEAIINDTVKKRKSYINLAHVISISLLT